MLRAPAVSSTHARRPTIAPLALLLTALALSAGCQREAADNSAPAGAGTEPRALATDQAPVETVDTALAEARAALREGRLVAPEGDNAIEAYLRALDIDPKSVAARQALLELIPPASSAVEASIASGDLALASYQLELLKRMEVSELRLAPLRNALGAARTRQEAALRAELAASLPADPPRPAAREDDARAVPATEPVAPATRTASATEATPSGVRALAPTGPTEDVATSEPPMVAQPSPASEAPSPGIESSPPASAPPAIGQVEEPVQIVDVRPTYPAQAMRRRIEGKVELEFVITADGEVTDVRVLHAEPENVFEREAIRAAQRWRFQPRRVDGVAVVGKGRKTLTFRLN